jgi:hypothetical protein
MDYVWAVLYILLLLAVLGLNVLSLPANWIILGMGWVWGLVHPGQHLGYGFYGPLIVLAVLGEAVELGAQFYGAKKYGGSNKGNIGAFIGALAGAIFCAPFLLGFGALPGAIIGAYLGCYLFERLHGRPSSEAWRAATGAMWGRVLGFVAKAGLGGAMVAFIARAAWPSARQGVAMLGF